MLDLRTRAKGPNETVDLSQVVGKSVIARDGQNIGSVVSFHVDPQTLVVEGMTINRGIFGENEYIGQEYMHSISRRGVVLDINPVTEAIGRDVYDARGKRVGQVKAVERKNNSNELVALEVNRGFMKKNLVFPKESVKEVGKGILLNVVVRG